MFGLTVVTEPASEPLSLEEAKEHLRYRFDDQAELIRSLIKAARRYCETATGKAFITQTLLLTRDCFPGYEEGYEFRLPKPPLQSLTPTVGDPDLGISYTNTASVLTTVDPTSYVVDTSTEVGRVALAWGEIWTTDALEQIATVKVRYVAGYGDTALSVPDTVKAAMNLLIGHWFDQREAASAINFSEVPMAVKSLLGVDWSGSYVGTHG